MFANFNYIKKIIAMKYIDNKTSHFQTKLLSKSKF
jgi:hypothetical protein